MCLDGKNQDGGDDPRSACTSKAKPSLTSLADPCTRLASSAYDQYTTVIIVIYCVNIAAVIELSRAREPERVTRGEQLESLGTSRWGWGAWRMTRPTGSMNANVQPGDRGRGPSVGLHGKEVMFNLHGTWIHKHTQELTWSHAWNASIIASFWTCQIFDRWHSRCCVPQVAVGSEWGQDAEGDWGCEDTSLVAWRTMSCSPHLFLLCSFLWPSLCLSSSSVFRGGSVGHSDGIRMHELFDNQSLL